MQSWKCSVMVLAICLLGVTGARASVHNNECAAERVMDGRVPSLNESAASACDEITVHRTDLNGCPCEISDLRISVCCAKAARELWGNALVCFPAANGDSRNRLKRLGLRISLGQRGHSGIVNFPLP